VVGLMFINQDNREEIIINKYYVISALAFIYLVLSVTRSLRSPYFLAFDDSSDVLIFRNYPVSIFNSRKKSFEIPKQHFVKFEIKKYFFGLEEKLIVYQLYRKKVARYPAIPLSAVDKADREKLKAALSRYSQKK